MAVFTIDDPDDPRIADYRNVPDPVLLEGQRVFVAEGRLVVRRLLEQKRLVIRSVMVTRPALDAMGLVGDPEPPVYLVPQQVMNTITGFNIHRGCLAVGERGAPLDWQRLMRTARRLVVLERVGNADNVGAIFRNAAAFGIDAVLLGPDCADPLYRKSIRTSMAAALTVPFAHVAPFPDALRQLRDDGFLVIGLSPCASAPPLRQVVATAPARVAFVAGHEGEGLTSAAMRACTVLARIPMAPGEDSVNVATAVAIALYEVSEKTGRAETAEGTGSHGGTGETGDERRSRSKE